MSDPFFKGNIAEAIKSAAGEKKLLIISIQGIFYKHLNFDHIIAKDNADCTQLDQEVWASSDVSSAFMLFLIIRLTMFLLILPSHFVFIGTLKTERISIQFVSNQFLY